ncbi:hypothetical protein J1TS3_24000 [Siminovitchia fordii]|uniref:Uncharacterized protein n=1 Tax=Siminovitchia fordii TaxID=254759 RepID=A0ABQ4K6L6_9BACI|nr:hypothetical protein J1TS3_24000 [Siminovitchia fordii]
MYINYWYYISHLYHKEANNLPYNTRSIRGIQGIIKIRGGLMMYKKHERILIGLAFGVAAIMLLSMLGRIFGS